MPLVGCV